VTFSADVAHAGAAPAWDGATVGELAGLAVPGDSIGVAVTTGEAEGEAAGAAAVPQAVASAAEQARTAAAASPRTALADDVIVGVPPAVAPMATQL
jgi:hypothetical protein